MTVKPRVVAAAYILALGAVAGCTAGARPGGEAFGLAAKACPGKGLSRGEIVEVAKKELASREPKNTYSEISVAPTDDKCAWLVVATRDPRQPGGARHILIANDGEIIEYRGGM